ncbi:hypothetical protein BN2497_3637 [Janthinobacterium sp. CG23_2]|nr:hypothetical protein BN2497_3637 [Janthinobacterium sp. CG23_2]CUU28216.1 hypothetical protein BN3177_3637 [Janthinobacterium sp. CG23_2]
MPVALFISLYRFHENAFGMTLAGKGACSACETLFATPAFNDGLYETHFAATRTNLAFCPLRTLAQPLQ